MGGVTQAQAEKEGERDDGLVVLMSRVEQTRH